MEARARAQAQVYAFFVSLLTVLVLVRCDERSALFSLRSSLGLRGRDWPIKTATCQWTGVECDGGGRVTSVTVSGLRRTHAGNLQPQFAVDALVNLTRLTRFNASGFALPGSIPDWFGEKLGALQVLDLCHASVNGPIPASLGGLTELRALFLSGNDLSGSLPSSLSKLSELSELDLSGNSLTGPIPPELSSLRNLTTLDLTSNFFSGPVPSELRLISGLQYLKLADNSLTDSIPGQLSELTKLLELNLSRNFLSGSLPSKLGNLRSLRVVDLSRNGLEGQLPEGLFSKLSQLRVLALNENKLDGGINGEFYKMPNLQILDFSSNNFTGPLPGPGSNFTVNLKNLALNFSNNFLYGNLSPIPFSSVDLSSNYLQGVVSETRGNVSLANNCLRISGQRSLVDCRMFYSSRSSVFDDFGPELKKRQWSRSGIKNRLTFILVGVFGGLGFIVILASILALMLLYQNKRGTNQRDVGPVVKRDSHSLPKDPLNLAGLGDSFSYEQILQFTDEFSEANLIKNGHSGDLYRGVVEGGIPVVIKKVDLSVRGSDSFMTELEFFHKVSHTRVVPLLGHCLEGENGKFLVYKHMPNGDLSRSLHHVVGLRNDDNGAKSMDWITRLKIATGAAEILAHLHHECNPPLVHRDIQASSILLDDKFEVRLGSLSDVHVHVGESNQHVITRLLRKPQTSGQGSSATDSASCAHDVYCFGKVLLELVTGKLGISKTDDATTKEWLEYTLRYVNIYDKELITKIVDPCLIVDEDLMQEVWATVIVARSCLNPRPSKRPLMKHILKALENPLKVLRVESSSSGSARLRTTSSRVSWSTAFLGSWRHSSSDNIKQSSRVGSQGSGGNDFSSSINKRLSSEIFPEPIEGHDLERQTEH